jgi:hypothetical protein
MLLLLDRCKDWFQGFEGGWVGEGARKGRELV